MARPRRSTGLLGLDRLGGGHHLRLGLGQRPLGLLELGLLGGDVVLEDDEGGLQLGVLGHERVDLEVDLSPLGADLPSWRSVSMGLPGSGRPTSPAPSAAETPSATTLVGLRRRRRVGVKVLSRGRMCRPHPSAAKVPGKVTNRLRLVTIRAPAARRPW